MVLEEVLPNDNLYKNMIRHVKVIIIFHAHWFIKILKVIDM